MELVFVLLGTAALVAAVAVYRLLPARPARPWARPDRADREPPYALSDGIARMPPGIDWGTLAVLVLGLVGVGLLALGLSQ